MEHSKLNLSHTIWKYFLDLTTIPRESGNEVGVQRYLHAYAQHHNLPIFSDTTGNIVLRCPATTGMEAVPSIAIQGHMDMVCVKTPESTHNFATDPLQIERDGDFLFAKETSLGADNGIAIAMVLALFQDKEIKHGPLEAIFTISEETGMDGAFGLDSSLIQSRLLINLDSEEEGIFYIGCAGGCEIDAHLDAEFVSPDPEAVSWRLEVKGFTGGHSGAEIHTGRGNALLFGLRALLQISSIEPISLISITSGSKRNVIPSFLLCDFSTRLNNIQTIQEIEQKLQEALRAEFGKTDPLGTITITKSPITPTKVVDSVQTEKLLTAVSLIPHGVDSMSKQIEGLVETSSNAAILKLENGVFSIVSSQRSSIMSARDEIAARCLRAAALSGATAKLVNAYPAWPPNPDSPFAKFCSKMYQEYSGKAPKITAIHAGLECGVINSKIPGMDSISFGPDLSGVHSTEERVSITSAERVYEFLTLLLGRM